MQEKVKAVRKLSRFSFEQEGSAVALVGPIVGGAANGHRTLVTKSLTKRTPEFIKKAQEIQITLSVPEFLEKFFGIWQGGSDNAVLASLMGYVAPEDEDEWDYESWITEKIQSYKIIKSLNESADITEALSALSDEEYLSVLTDQVTLEKAIEEFTAEQESSEVDTSTEVEKKVEASASKVTKKKEKQMANATNTVESQVVELQKSLNDKEVALKKALEQIAEIEKVQKAVIVKAKTDKVQSVLKDEKQVQAIMKAALALETDEDFDAFVEVLKSLNDKAEKSDMFKELGASGDAPEVTKDEGNVMKLLKSKYNKK